MTDPLQSLERISNASAAAIYTLNTKRIVLLGDFHVPDARDCSRCVYPKCADYSTLIHELDAYHKETGTELDVFLEIFAPEDMKSYAQRMKYYLLRSKLNATIGNILYSKKPHLLELRRQLDRKVFFHGRNTLQRYHAIDFRDTPDVKDALLDVYEFLANLKAGPSKLERYIETLTQQSLKAYPTKERLFTRIYAMCFASARKPNRIQKQVAKLSPEHRRMLQAFFRKMFDHYYLYNKKVRLFLHLNLATLATDIYALARFLRFMSQQVEGSTSVFLAGARHTWHYSLFLQRLGAKRVFDTHSKLGFEDERSVDPVGVRQCVRIP